MRVLTLIRAEWREWKAETQLITKRNLCFLLIAFLIIFVGFRSLFIAGLGVFPFAFVFSRQS